MPAILYIENTAVGDRAYLKASKLANIIVLINYSDAPVGWKNEGEKLQMRERERDVGRD